MAVSPILNFRMLGVDADRFRFALLAPLEGRLRRVVLIGAGMTCMSGRDGCERLLISVGEEDKPECGAMAVGDCMIRSESGPMAVCIQQRPASRATAE